MFSIMDVTTAKQTILKRSAIDEITVPEKLLAQLAQTFGEPIQPAEAVRRILQDIRRNGDAALQSWTKRLDWAEIPQPRIPEAAIQAALTSLDPALRSALEEAAGRIEKFHRKQPLISWIDQSLGGTLGQILRPIQQVGFYVPGGTAPLPSSVLMSVIPARVAGVSRIVIATPPARQTGEMNPVILAAAAIAGADEIYAAGGAQAIGALAFGTETILQVDKIVGPGNLFVTLAKQQVFGRVGIDGLAGPTETVLIADEYADPAWAAADLLAQAEHDILASAILLTPSRSFAGKVQTEIENFLTGKETIDLGRKEIILQSLAARGGAVITGSIAEAIALSNEFAPEHVSLAVKDAWGWLDSIQAAGGVFLGEHSCEVMGDYIAGPSHIMPTGGTARFSSPLNLWDFVRIISVVNLDSKTAARLGAQAEQIARAEGLNAHALAGSLRSQSIPDL